VLAISFHPIDVMKRSLKAGCWHDVANLGARLLDDRGRSTSRAARPNQMNAEGRDIPVRPSSVISGKSASAISRRSPRFQLSGRMN